MSQVLYRAAPFLFFLLKITFLWRVLGVGVLGNYYFDPCPFLYFSFVC